MRRLIDLFRLLPGFVQRGFQRIGARAAIVAVVVVVGGIAAWQGTSYLKRDKTAAEPKGPTKQIATGPDGAGDDSSIAQAGATLTDDQLPGGAASGKIGLVSHGGEGPPPTAPTASPTASPYLPSDNDPAGGYGTSSATIGPPADAYAGYGQSAYGGAYGGSPASDAAPAYGGAADSSYSPASGGPPPTTPPSDPSQQAGAGAAPPNPYRSGATASLSDDSDAYGAALAPGATAADPSASSAQVSDAPAAVAAQSTSDLATSDPVNSDPSVGASAPSANTYTVDDSSTTSALAGSYGGLAGDAASSTAAPIGASPAVPRTTTDSATGGARPNVLPGASLSDNPYAAAAQSNALSAGIHSGGGSYGGSALEGSGGQFAPGGAAGSVASSASGLASATPGQRPLEGPQQPVVVIEKHAPPEIQIGKPATLMTIVRNQGQVPAHNVTVTDHVPTGTQLTDVRPQPQQSASGALVWSLGTLQPGEEKQLMMQVMPEAEGEIGSTAQLTFAAVATSRSISTRPQLTIEQQAPAKVLIGEPLMIGITVRNPGSGPATGVVIEEDVPASLSHAAGAQLEYEIGTLRPGEFKQLQLALKAEKAGVVENTIYVHGEGGLTSQHTVQIEVVAPQLQVGIEGPKVRFLERQATYTLQIANPGTAAARDVELMAVLPRGMKFVQTNAQGHYDVTQHAVIWSLAELPPAEAGKVKLTMLPVEPGEQKLQVVGRAGLGLSATGEQLVHVQQSAELLHSVKDLDDVIEVGSETTYEVRVTNAGTKAATNVRVAAALPAGLSAQSGEGPTRVEESSNASQVVFEPLARLNPQEEVIFKIHVRGEQAGDHIVRVQLSSDEWPNPVTREERTQVYQDR